MKTKFLNLLLIIPFVFWGYTPVNTRTCKVDLKKTIVKVSGSSNIHDWDVKVTNLAGEATFEIGTDNTIAGVSSLDFNFYSKSLKSGKDGMDEKTYESLNADKYPIINFKLLKITDRKIINNTPLFVADGNLTINGITKQINLTSFVKIDSAGNITIQGAKSIDMTNYGISPPTAMFGTIVAGKEVTITFSIVLN